MEHWDHTKLNTQQNIKDGTRKKKSITQNNLKILGEKKIVGKQKFSIWGLNWFGH
jgi:hypothetical protein